MNENELAKTIHAIDLDEGTNNSSLREALQQRSEQITQREVVFLIWKKQGYKVTYNGRPEWKEKNGRSFLEPHFAVKPAEMADVELGNRGVAKAIQGELNAEYISAPRIPRADRPTN